MAPSGVSGRWRGCQSGTARAWTRFQALTAAWAAGQAGSKFSSRRRAWSVSLAGTSNSSARIVAGSALASLPSRARSWNYDSRSIAIAGRVHQAWLRANFADGSRVSVSAFERRMPDST